jgi:predicted DNA-binding transcriptional regulator YafY
MDKLERLYALHTLLAGRRRAVGFDEITEHLGCSAATAKRAMRELRQLLGAPLIHDSRAGGYRYELAEGEQQFELPGLWFGASELAALVTMHELLVRLEPGLLGEALAPLAERLRKILAQRGFGLVEAARRVRVVSQHARPPGAAFPLVARAVLARRRLTIDYARRSDGETTQREVSPQRVVRYRGCWYLDAWCHRVDGLRSFAVERIAEPTLLPTAALDLPDAVLDAHFADAYGIFAGRAGQTAVLRFSPRRARWVADEVWHPRQEATFLDDGSYELRIPYGRSDELIQDILRLGAEVEVLEPPDLRAEVIQRLTEAADRYRR